MNKKKELNHFLLDYNLNEFELVDSGDFIFLDAYFEDRAIESLVIEYIPTSKYIGGKEKHECFYQKLDFDNSLVGKQQSGEIMSHAKHLFCNFL